MLTPGSGAQNRRGRRAGRDGFGQGGIARVVGKMGWEIRRGLFFCRSIFLSLGPVCFYPCLSLFIRGNGARRLPFSEFRVYDAWCR